MSFELRSRTQWSRFLSTIVLSAIIILQLSCTVAAPPKTATWKNSTGAEGFQRLFWQAVKDKDWLQVESHIASNFVYLGASGSKDKQQTLAYLRGLDLKDFSLGEVAVTDSGADAVVTYSLSMISSANPTNSAAVRHMAIWQQQKSGWVLIALSEVAGSRP